MNKGYFKVGDIVRGTAGYYTYDLVDRRMRKGKVISVKETPYPRMCIEVVEHDWGTNVGKKVWVKNAADKFERIEPTPKFKAGDKVKILDGSKIERYTGSWTFGMKSDVGKVVTIKEVEIRDNRIGYYMEEVPYLWDERGLEKAKETKKPVKKAVKKEEPTFKVGDRVVAISNVMFYPTNGKSGTIFGIDNGLGVREFAVEFDEPVNGHNCGGFGVKPGKDGHCVWCKTHHLKLEESKKEVKKEEPKFKVGDIVRGTHPDRYGITNTKMTKGEVIHVHSDGEFNVKILEHENPYEIGQTYDWLTPKYFEKVEEPVKNTIVIYQKDREVVAHDKVTGKKGFAYCHPDDEFDFKTGAKIAFDRLMGAPKIVKQAKYEVGDKVKIVDKWVEGCRQNSVGEMDKHLGTVMTIRSFSGNSYKMEEDEEEHYGDGWFWYPKAIEGKVIEPTEEVKKEEPIQIDKVKVGDLIRMKYEYYSVPAGVIGEVVKVTDACAGKCLVDFKFRYAGTHSGCGELKTRTGLYLTIDNQCEKVVE